MFDEKRPDWLRRFTQEDMLAVGMRTALGALGPFGAIVGEFVTQLVPQQRLDRLNDFVEQIHERLSSLEEDFAARIKTSAPYAALAEEATAQAVHTPSDARRRELADLLRTGLSRADAELIEHHALLKILETLNDIQVLILMQYGSFSQAMYDSGRANFINQHSSVLNVQPPGLGDNEAKSRPWDMYNHYVDDLIARGLLRDTEGIAKSGPGKVVQITNLGRLLLLAIGKPSVRT